MSIDFAKTSHIGFFGAVIPLVSWFISQWFFEIFQDWPSWLEGPSPIAIYGIVYFLFDKYLWRWGGFQKLGIVWFPNLNGRWKGVQRSSYKKNGKNKTTKGVLEITQSFSKIQINAYYNRSESYSVAANFAELNGEVYLFYTYDNDPSSLRDGTMEKHRGTVKLKLLPTEKKINGGYWNSVGNYGELDFEFDQKKILGRV